jgi:hypothetical protein
VQEVNESMQDFQRFFLEHRIWLDVPLVNEIQGMNRKMREGTMFEHLVRRMPRDGDQLENWRRAWEIMDKHVPPHPRTD